MDSLILTTDSSTQKEKLITGNDEVAWGSFEKLQKAKRATIEMENVSIDIGRELNNHTEKMNSIGSKLTDTNKELTVSSGVISRMMRLQRQNKLIIALFSIALITALLVILFVKLTSSNSNSKANNSNN
jgi:predicted RND superfamily exporter protein